MAPAEALLKKQGQQEVLKDIAAQAAELVALKKDHAVISTERAATDASEKRKAAEKMMREARADVSEEPQEESKEEKEKEEEVAVTQPKSLKDRVPWLAAGNMKSNLSRGKVDRKRRIGVTERPPEMENNEEEGGDIIPPPPEFLPADDHQNGYTEVSASRDHTPALPANRDHSTDSRRSTRNPTTRSVNPASSSKSRPKGVQLDDDYYTQMMDT